MKTIWRKRGNENHNEGGREREGERERIERARD